MVFAIVFAGVGVARPGISRVYLMKSSCLCLFVGGGEWSRLCYGYGSIRLKAHTNAAYKNSIRFKHTVCAYGLRIRFAHTVYAYAERIQMPHTNAAYGLRIRSAYGLRIRFTHTPSAYGLAHTV